MPLTRKEKREEIIVAIFLGLQAGLTIGFAAVILNMHYQPLIGCVSGGVAAGISSAILLVRISKK